ncbi:carbohydrate ABC transporter permease [Ruania alba]|uniref:ABC-type glycerol-3-phosphate transport system, permease component n=1 Tax=Ruania alba TaxID=648782 RepID=A0A1H5D512_9MICO|nr:carbohydrate ABC transporter permease [Ruania alba]SED73904.1 ABC-type glycerol-3-phosphate transport system, permease component [Ruania alba]
MASRRRGTFRAGRTRYLAHGAAWAYVVALALPLYYLLISSVKSTVEIIDQPFLPSLSPTFSNFANAFNQADLGRAMVSSIYVTLGAEVLTLAVTLPAAYAIARARARTGRVLETIFGAGFLIPGFAALVPSVLLAIAFRMFHTREFLILILGAAAIPMAVLLLTQAMRTVPRELEEAASIDGAGQARVFWTIYVPLTVPTMSVVAILNFLNFWNEYFFALVIGGTGPDVRTAQVALPTLSAATNAQFGILAAGVVITLVPVYLAYAAMARRMESAILAGALKG